MSERQEWLTVDDVAEQLKVHPDSVRRWLRAGRLKGHLISRRAGYRIRPEDVERFVTGERRTDREQE
jgi:excisionase family DNA binding protein